MMKENKYIIIPYIFIKININFIKKVYKKNKKSF